MKKALFKVAMIATVVGVLVASCKKEQETVSIDKGKTEINDPQNDAIVNRILDFKKKVNERKMNPGMKSGETMTLKEAMDNVTDLFNVTFTEPTAYYTAMESHQFSINVPLTVDGEVLVDDVVAAYEQAVAEAREVYHTSSLPNKGYRRLMATFDMQRDGGVGMNFNGQFGSKTDHPHPPTPHIDGPFTIGDDWHYKDGMGSCDGIHPGGADKALEDTIMEIVRADWPKDPTNCRGFYTGFTTCEFSPLTGHTGVFYSADPDDTCIGWQFMNDYLNGEKRNIYQVVPQVGTNLNYNYMLQYRYYVTNVMIEGRGDEESGPIYHWTEVEYARYNYIENGIIERSEL